MKSMMKYLVVLCLFSFISEGFAMESETLSAKQTAIVPIASFTASGDVQKLKQALNEGLDAGLTINEIKEVLVQLYAYAGFPRCLNALGALTETLEARRNNGITDEAGREAGPFPPAGRTSLELGAETQTALVGAPVRGGLMDFAPAVDQFLKAHLFGDIFGRDNLDWQSREIATVSALASIPGVESQLRSHMNISMNIGITPGQLRKITATLGDKVDADIGHTARTVLDSILGTSNSDIADGVIFPRGPENAEYAQYFVGTSYLTMLTTTDVPIGNVTFEPGCRNNWHIHHKGGQILLVTGGRGWYQEEGKPAQELHAGDVVNIPAGVKHWHGAAEDSWFVHLAVSVPAEGASTEWCEPVSDAVYSTLK
ncbi:MAG: carboxymuconolactone decarboxylase family protein [Planctomycetaceae bacterium]|nr:carboxymuconolactone decarboxylase family protein [Planctomycetaceae bacterium]